MDTGESYKSPKMVPFHEQHKRIFYLINIVLDI